MTPSALRFRATISSRESTAPSLHAQTRAQRLYRGYHDGRDDYALYLEQDKDAMEAEGYHRLLPLNYWIGYAYPAADAQGHPLDADGDHVLDSFELIIGTDPQRPDSDCDGLTDGDEVLVYDPATHGYGDPQDGPCATLFGDGFETGDTSRWSSVTGAAAFGTPQRRGN